MDYCHGKNPLNVGLILVLLKMSECQPFLFPIIVYVFRNFYRILFIDIRRVTPAYCISTIYHALQKVSGLLAVSSYSCVTAT